MPGDSHHQRKEQQFWRRSLLASWAAVVAAVAAVCFAAGAFTQARQQADTAQDQEVRSLRAYVSVDAAPALTPDGEGLPGVLVKAENVGQTPAHQVYISSLVTITGRGDPLVKDRKGEDCAYITETATGGLSLGRKPFEERFGVGLSKTKLAQATVASGIYEVRADILVCYRDVFNAVRHVRACRRYFNGWNRTITCQGEQDEHD